MFFTTSCTSSSVNTFGGEFGVPGKMNRGPDLLREIESWVASSLERAKTLTCQNFHFLCGREAIRSHFPVTLSFRELLSLPICACASVKMKKIHVNCVNGSNITTHLETESLGIFLLFVHASHGAMLGIVRRTEWERSLGWKSRKIIRITQSAVFPALGRRLCNWKWRELSGSVRNDEENVEWASERNKNRSFSLLLWLREGRRSDGCELRCGSSSGAFRKATAVDYSTRGFHTFTISFRVREW